MRATFVTRTSETNFTTANSWDTIAPRLLNFPQPSHFTFKSSNCMITQVRPIRTGRTGSRPCAATASPVVLDVREPCELRTASIKADGFELITIPMGVIPPRLTELDPEQPVACLCHHGARSMQVAAFSEGARLQTRGQYRRRHQRLVAEVDPSVPRY